MFIVYQFPKSICCAPQVFFCCYIFIKSCFAFTYRYSWSFYSIFLSAIGSLVHKSWASWQCHLPCIWLKAQAPRCNAVLILVLFFVMCTLFVTIHIAQFEGLGQIKEYRCRSFDKEYLVYELSIVLISYNKCFLHVFADVHCSHIIIRINLT